MENKSDLELLDAMVTSTWNLSGSFAWAAGYLAGTLADNMHYLPQHVQDALRADVKAHTAPKQNGH